MPRRYARPVPAADAAPTSLPASWYVHPDHYERERHAIFERTWLCVGFAHQVAGAGDYVADTIAGFGVFVQRGADGALRGFHNVCPHRAGPIVWPGQGCVGNLVCRYHGWAFEPDGKLRAARDFGADVPGVDGLQPLAVGEWRGLVFACLDPSAEPLAAWLGHFPEVAEPFPLESYRFHRRDVHRLAANWKCYADNYLEGYHIPLVHPALTRAVDIGRYTVTAHDGGRWNRHDVPTRPGAATAGAWAFLYPHLALNIYPTGMNVERLIPRGPQETDVVFDYFFADPDHPSAAASIAASSELMAEDKRIVEAVQQNLAGGRYDTGLLSPRHEVGLTSFQALVRRAVDAAATR